MIRLIAAIDSKDGIADDGTYKGAHGFPWIGLLPNDAKYFKQLTMGGVILMGYGEYLAQSKKPLPGRTNIVATTSKHQVAPGFTKVNSARQYLSDAKHDVWVTGGAGLFATTIDLADELYITQLRKDFHCTKFFPQFRDDFVLKSESKPFTENGITYSFQVWRRQV